jgi:putative transposase
MTSKKYILSWGTKYKKSVLYGQQALEVREHIRKICIELNVSIVKGVVRKDQIQIVVLVPEDLPLPKLLGYIKGKSARAMFQDNKIIQETYPNRHLWAEGYHAQEISS